MQVLVKKSLLVNILINLLHFDTSISLKDSMCLIALMGIIKVSKGFISHAVRLPSTFLKRIWTLL